MTHSQNSISRLPDYQVTRSTSPKPPRTTAPVAANLTIYGGKGQKPRFPTPNLTIYGQRPQKRGFNPTCPSPGHLSSLPPYHPPPPRIRTTSSHRTSSAGPMYLQHYNFQQLPFRNTPDPTFFFETPRHN
jgi:hypothetical protein